MAKVYLDKLLFLVDRLAPECPVDTGLECKHFFSGAALYVKKRICITLTPVGLAIKLPRKTREQLLQNKTAVPLRYFSHGPIKKEYVLFTQGIEAIDEVLLNYMKQSIKYVSSLSQPDTNKKSRIDHS